MMFKTLILRAITTISCFRPIKNNTPLRQNPPCTAEREKFLIFLNVESGKKPVLKQEDKQGKSLKS